MVPNWLEQDYFRAIQDLAEIGSSEVMSEGDADAIRAMLSVIAIAKGARTHARLLIEYSDGKNNYPRKATARKLTTTRY